MKVSVLASGSSGNCFYVQEKETAVLVDAGISRKQIAERMHSLGLKPEIVKGIFITHEHADHVKGADVFSRLYNVPIYATRKTIEKCFLCSNFENIYPIKNNETVKVGGLNIEAFSKDHEAVDPVSFKISNSKTITIATDLGIVNQNVEDAVSDSDFLCIESNHDIKMLEEGPYPYFLKQWIKSSTGHLSNSQSAIGVLEHAKPKLKNIVLSHLSEKNNTPLLALDAFSQLIKHRLDLNPKLSISNRFKPTPLFKI